MKDVKHLIELSSDWLFGHIKGIFVSFVIILAIQVTNWLDLFVLFTSYEKISGAMGLVWWVDFGFTAIAVANWGLRKLGQLLRW